jgi:hypothetical protein
MRKKKPAEDRGLDQSIHREAGKTVVRGMKTMVIGQK